MIAHSPCMCTCSCNITPSSNRCYECGRDMPMSVGDVVYGSVRAPARRHRETQLERVHAARRRRIDKTAAATAAAVLKLGRVSMRRPLPPHRFVRHPRIKRASAKG